MKLLTCLFLCFLSLTAFGADGYLARTNGNIVIGPGGSGGGGSQTPVIQDINGGGFQYTNMGNLTSTGTVIFSTLFTATNYIGDIVLSNSLSLNGTNSGSILISNATSTVVLAQFGPDDYWFMTNTTTTKTIVASNGTITAFAFAGDGSGLTGLPSFSESKTNSWTTNTAFAVCPSQSITNFLLVSGANTACGVTGILNAGTSTERYGQLLIIASGNITFTNPAAFHASDFATTRVITNANNCFISFDVWPGLATNMAIMQTR